MDQEGRESEHDDMDAGIGQESIIEPSLCFKLERSVRRWMLQIKNVSRQVSEADDGARRRLNIAPVVIRLQEKTI